MRLLPHAAALLIAWGVFAFGAVHEWALWPLIGSSALLGTVSLALAERRPSRGRLAMLGAIAMALAIQVVPLPQFVLNGTGPGLGRALSAYSVGFATGSNTWHALSIAPHLTGRAILVFVALALCCCGISAALEQDTRLLRRMVVHIAVIAMAVGLFALIQKATFNRRIYWFWDSEFGGYSNYYGPFVNRNHFAGWMVLASALSGGMLLGRMATSLSAVRAGWRHRILWLSTPEAAAILLTATALLTMVISTVWSMSRSGMAATALALLMLTLVAMWTQQGLLRGVALGTLTGVTVLVIALRGADTLANWYGRTDTFAWRVQLWQDTLAPLKDFWLVGSGVNTYGTLMLLYPQSDTTLHAAQAHNDYLQLAVEGGLLMTVVAVGAIALLVREVLRRLKEPQDAMTWWIRMGAVSGICGMAVQETVEFSLQIPGVALLFTILIAIAIHKTPVTNDPRALSSPLSSS
jgi:O-antigen ligase